jgi:isopenicillin N synthase-like dioxygenase
VSRLVPPNVSDVVPRIDVGALLDGSLDSSASRDVQRQIRTACCEIGFMTVVGHGVPRERIEAAVAAAERFFALPEEAKLDAAPRHWNPTSPNVYRGYFPSSVAGKEGLDVGEPDIEDPLLLRRPYHERNRVPDELGADSWLAITEYFDALSSLAASLLRGLVAALGGRPGLVDDSFARPASLSTLRFNFYPERDQPVARSEEDDAMLSCEAHVDSGLLTLLHQDDRGGLQVKGADARWHSLAPDADAFVVNTGLALQRMTDQALVATQHRVLYERRRRISIPFFFEPIPDFVMDASSLELPFPPARTRQVYESFLRESLAKFSEYAR